MSLIDAARHRLRTLLRSGAVDRERDEEFAFHQSLAAADHEHSDDVSDPRRAARREFGNVTFIKEEIRWMGALRWVDHLRQDLRFAVRTLSRSPIFATVTVLTIGLSIGANTAVFGVISGLLLEPLAIRQPNELMQLWRVDREGHRHQFFTLAEYEALRAVSGIDVSLLSSAGVARATIAGVPYTRVEVNVVDGGFFPMLGVDAGAGRLLTPEDDRSATPVAVLGFASAVRYFGSARAAVGQRITLQAQVFTVVGVLQREFRGLDLVSPMTIAVARGAVTLLGDAPIPLQATPVRMVARVSSGSATTPALEQAFAGCCAQGQLIQPHEELGDLRSRSSHRLVLAGISHGISAGKFDVRAMFGPILYALMAGVALILLIACTNVGNLLLARATVRSRELAVRMSLGASRARIVWQLLAESLLLAIIGAAFGIILAMWGTAALAEYLPGNLRMLQPFVVIVPNRTMIAFTTLVATVSIIIYGVWPAIRATRFDPVLGLRSGSLGSTRAGRLDRGLIAFQMSLAVVLVASAGLFGATLSNLRSGLGEMRVDRLLVAEVEAMPPAIPAGSERVVYDRILERLPSVPGIAAVAGTDVMPLIYMMFSTSTLDVEGFEHVNVDGIRVEHSPLGAGIIYTTPGFFATTGSGLVAGREFGDGDAAGTPRVAIISETIARQFFAGRDPIGQYIGFRGGRRELQIVGIARDVKQTDLRAATPRTLYLPRAQRHADSDRFTYAMRTTGAASTAAAAARAAIAAAAPEVIIRSVQPMSELVAFSVGREQALRSVAIVFSVVAVGLAAIGLYGVLAFRVTSRSREIGIRMALGADPSKLVRMVIRESLAVVVGGVAVGVPLALAASSALRALLYGVSPFATMPLIVAVAVLIGAGMLAALLPSRSASRVDPMIAMRSE